MDDLPGPEAPARRSAALAVTAWGPTAARISIFLALLVLLRLTAAVVVPLAWAALLFTLLSPAVEGLQQRRVPAAVGAAALLFGPAAAFGWLALRAAPAAADWWQRIVAASSNLGRALDAFAGRAGFGAHATRGLTGYLASQPAALAAWARRSAPSDVLVALAVLMLAYFLLLEQRALYADVLAALPRERTRWRVAGALREARDGIVRYIAAMAAMNLALALTTGLALAALGLPDLQTWVMVIFALLFIPYLGPLAITLLLAAGGQRSGAIVLAPAAFLLLHALEANFVSPVLIGRVLRLRRPVLLVAVLCAASVWGWAGSVLAIPMLIAARAVLRRCRGHPIALVLIAPRDARANAPAEAAEGAIAAPPRVREMPTLVQSSPRPCASPSSPKPIRPRSTASR